MDKTRVVVAMSGGVDSSVAAALLVQQGYDVIGMMLRLWNEPCKEAFNRCCTPYALAQAKKVASILNIPFYIIDAQIPFYNSVVKYFLQSYLSGCTPNPCLICNREIRWGYLMEHALAIGSDFMATGHYVRKEYNNEGQFLLKKGLDSTKDQSYVLHVLNQNQLSHSLFPLGRYLKTEVRQLARDFNLPVADKEESQDLCFLADEDYRSFILRNTCVEIKPGLIVNTQNEILGQHNGLPFYTIGQRKGLKISTESPYYVIKKDIQNNVLIVGKTEERASKYLWVENVNWISGIPPITSNNIKLMVRYRSKEKPCTIQIISPSRIHIDLYESIDDVAPGQAAVFYQDDICLGGGIIT